MIISCMRKWYDDEMGGFFKCCEFCECRRTSASDGDICISDEARETLLIYPVEELEWGMDDGLEWCLEILSHISIEFTENENDLISI